MHFMWLTYSNYFKHTTYLYTSLSTLREDFPKNVHLLSVLVNQFKAITYILQLKQSDCGF